jgi:hypothetical protein
MIVIGLGMDKNQHGGKEDDGDEGKAEVKA